MKHIIFDIETAPLPASDINSLAPEFEAPGNYKDPAKIAANIEEQKVKWLEQAALSPVTGCVCAIGILHVNDTDSVDSIYTGHDDHDEASAITQFWDFWRTHSERNLLIGFNIYRFDLPFLMRRSWKLGIPVPLGLRDGRYFNRMTLDLMEVWQLGNREERISLAKLAMYLGVGVKEGSGKDFHLLPIAQKIKYLTNDLVLTREVAKRVGVL